MSIWIAALATLFAVVYGIDTQHYVSTNSEPELLTRVTYTAFHRIAWGFGMGWIIFASFHDYGGTKGVES